MRNASRRAVSPRTDPFGRYGNRLPAKRSVARRIAETVRLRKAARERENVRFTKLFAPFPLHLAESSVYFTTCRQTGPNAKEDGLTAVDPPNYVVGSALK